MKRIINLVFINFILFFSLSSTSLGTDLRSLGWPEDPPSSEILNIKLNNSDLPSGAVYRGQNIMRHQIAAGWFKNPQPHSWNDYNPGLVENWRIGNAYMNFKYGFFPSQGEATFGTLPTIGASLGAESNPVTKQNSTSFNGQIFGDVTYSWHSDMEQYRGMFDKDPHGQPYPSEFAGIVFSKGRFASAILSGVETVNGHIDKNIMENFAQKILMKIEVATSLNNFDVNLSNLVTQQGILRSLQAKLDAFTKNYRKGDYKTALNNINAFINELNAQRGKHVSEQAYQTLKIYAETIIMNVNTLM